jgi:hypothetical protein
MESVETATPNSLVLPEQRDLRQGVIVILSGGPVIFVPTFDLILELLEVACPLSGRVSRCRL